jgi:hypothetical protein
MSWDTAGTVTVAALGVVAGGLQYARSRDDRSGIKRDLEILAMLSPASEAHQALSRYVEARVVRTVRTREGARRDPAGVRLAFFCLVMALLSASLGASMEGGWGATGVGTGIGFLAMAVYGAAISIPKRMRDARGNPIKEEAA